MAEGRSEDDERLLCAANPGRSKHIMKQKSRQIWKSNKYSKSWRLSSLAFYCGILKKFQILKNIKWKSLLQKHFLKSSFDIAGWLGDGTLVSLVAAAFWTDAGTKEILDFWSALATCFRAPLLLGRKDLPRVGVGCLSGLAGGAEMATDKTRSINSFWSIFMTAVDADLSFSNSM